MKLGTRYTLSGMIRVLSSSAKTRFFPAKRIFANAYAASAEVASTPATVTTAVIMLLRKKRLKLACTHASA